MNNNAPQQASGASETTRFFCTRISSAAGAAGAQQQHKKEPNMASRNTNPSGATQTLPSSGLPATPRRQCRNRHKRILANMFDVDNCNTCDSGQCPAPMKKECSRKHHYRNASVQRIRAWSLRVGSACTRTSDTSNPFTKMLSML